MVNSVVRRVEEEHHGNARQFSSEELQSLADLAVVDRVDREDDRVPTTEVAHIAKHSLDRYSADPFKRPAEAIDADPGEVGFQAEASGAIGAYVRTKEANITGKLDDIRQTVPSVAPQVGFPARDVQHANTFFVVVFQGLFDLRHAHCVMIHICNPAADTIEVAAVVRDKAQDVRAITLHDEKVDTEPYVILRFLQYRGHSLILAGHASRMDLIHTVSM